MSDATYEDRYAAARSELEDLLERHAGVFGRDLELPAPVDYVLIVAVDDAGDGKGGLLQIVYPQHQWIHRTLGLMEWAKVRVSNRGIPDDDP